MKSKYLLLATLFCSSFVGADEALTQIDTFYEFDEAVWFVAVGGKDISWLDELLNSSNSSYLVTERDLRSLIYQLPYTTELITRTLNHHFKNKDLNFKDIDSIASTYVTPGLMDNEFTAKNYKNFQEGLFPLETLKIILSFVTTPNGYEEIIKIIKKHYYFRNKQKELAIALIQKRYQELEMIRINKEREQQALRNAEHNAATYKRLSRLFPEIENHNL